MKEEKSISDMIAEAEDQKQFKSFHPLLRMWFNEQLHRGVVDIAREANEYYNQHKRFWQRKKPTRFTADIVPRLFIVPPFFIPDFDKAERLLDKRLREYKRLYHPELLNK